MRCSQGVATVWSLRPKARFLLFRAKRAREQLRHAASDFGETRAEAVFGDMMRASHHEYRAFIAVYNHATASQAALFPRRQTALDQPVAVETRAPPQADVVRAAKLRIPRKTDRREAYRSLQVYV